MMNRIYRVGYILTILCFIGIIITLIIGINLRQSYESPNVVNLARVKVNPVYNLIQNIWPVSSESINKLDSVLNQQNIDVTVTNLEGSIVYKFNSEYSMDYKVDLKEHLYSDQSYKEKNNGKYLISFPIYNEGTVVGFAIFNVYIQLEEFKYPIQWTVSIVLLSLLLSTSIIATITSYKRNNSSNRFEELIYGLENVTKGIYKPIKIPKDLQQQPIYTTYNRMIEELYYIMRKQKSNEVRRKSFLTTIGHELKTPLATINAYIEGLTSGVAKDKAKVESYHLIIQDKMQNLMRQVDDLFRYAQDDMDQLKFNLTEVYADELFNKIVTPLRTKDNERKIIIKDQLPKCLINVDVIRIEQVILNLYNNAIKHTEVDGQLIIQGYRQENELLISIEDNGEGIEPTDLPHIFDHFYQGNKSKKTDYEGVGLGLAICKEIINKHNGRIFVKSKVGKGTKISFTIPIV